MGILTGGFGPKVRKKEHYKKKDTNAGDRIVFIGRVWGSKGKEGELSENDCSVCF